MNQSKNNQIDLSEEQSRAHVTDIAHWLSEDLVMESSRVDRAAQDLLELIYDCVQTQRKSPKRHLPQLRLLILNLLKTRHLSLDKMTVRFDAGAYSEMRHFSFRVLIQLLMHALIEMKWLSKRPGWTQRIGGAVSRVCIEAPLEAI